MSQQNLNQIVSEFDVTQFVSVAVICLVLVAGVDLVHFRCILLWPSLLCPMFFFLIFVLLLYGMASVSVESMGFACEELVIPVADNTGCLTPGGYLGWLIHGQQERLGSWEVLVPSFFRALAVA
jgi:hypothetical protein